MSNKTRSAAGKFAPKSETPRKIRSVNLTDDAWQWLASVAQAVGMTRNDYLESLAGGVSPLMETVLPEIVESVNQPNLNSSPLMETANTDTIPFMEMANTATTPFVEMGQTEGEELNLAESALKREIEELQRELRSANRQLAEQDKELLQLHERNGDLGLEVQNLKEELAVVTRDRDEIQNSAPTVADFPEPADLLNQLKARRKKSKADLADMEAVLDILGTDGSEN